MSDGMTSHLKSMHQMALQLEGLITALNSCIDDADRQSVCVSMIEEAAVIAPKLSSLTDRVDTQINFRRED